jgi:hypothetical protein
MLAAVACATMLAITGCATKGPVASDVTSFGSWPAGRSAGTFAFERLPSQASSAAQSDLEQAARGALGGAGFREVDMPAAQYVVQVGADLIQSGPGYYGDRVGVFGAVGGGGRGGGFSAGGIGLSFGGGGQSTVGRAVSIVIRDKASNQSLYESRARSDNAGPDDARAWSAMFAAALKDFPSVAISPRRVLVEEP